ncbi:glycoside hydrolase family 7 protein [Colletotrichum truncatum]|uniref:Glycoside hydrolase family 7 protein n=1 Tax=Colletotrichum truncatum TaxID=5467 RepID=A0ACC3ZC24_COLTU
MLTKVSAIAALVAAVRAQQACTLNAENKPALTWSNCEAGGTCTKVNGAVTVDANWRWTHQVSSSTNCYSGNKWDTSICSGTGEDCASKCCLDGADYSGTYGATTSGDALNLKFVTQGPYSKNIGSRMFLMDASGEKYEMFKLLGKEFTFDVDVSNMGCGLNGALYFVSMDADGGASKYPGNKAGAKYGTGYCDSQCPRDLKFIDGKANIEGWVPSSNDVNSGVGNMGSCCSEMDIWEANSVSTAYTPHPCEEIGQKSCSGDACGGTYSATRYAGTCDPDGCDFNSYRMGNTTFYGKGSQFTIDTSKKITVVTQFIESGGALSDIKRFYVQDGKVFVNSKSDVAGVEGNSVNTEFCTAQKKAFGDDDVFTKKGGLAQMGKAVEEGMVLVMSNWDDHHSNMLWLDSSYPTDKTGPGVARGTCGKDSGVPADVESQAPNSNVIFSNIKVGPIGSTFNSAGTGSASPASSSTIANVPSDAVTSQTSTPVASATSAASSAPAVPSVEPVPIASSSAAAAVPVASSSSVAAPIASQPAGGEAVALYHQCGGLSYSGATKCQSGLVCKQWNEYYHQCVAGDEAVGDESNDDDDECPAA